MPDRDRAVSIVMIEDDEGHARLIEKNMRRAGVANDIVAFATGGQALDYLFSAKPPRSHLILLDLNLPDMSGVDILRAIKSNDNTRLAPVIVLTTTDDKREVRKCYDLGANGYIVKPLNYDHFADAIRQLGIFLSVIQIPYD
jgi:DNA-binding response OmpR family regulator